MLIDDIQAGLAVFVASEESKQNAKVSLELGWCNSYFEAQFELSTDAVEDKLNLQIFKKYFKSNEDDKQLISLLEIIHKAENPK